MIGIVGSVPESVLAAIEAVEEPVMFDSAAAVAEVEADMLIVQGRNAISELLEMDPDRSTPILAINASNGLPDVGPIFDQIDNLVADSLPTVSSPTLAVTSDDTMLGRAAFEAMLVASDPGHIDEYSLASGTKLDQIRADGVVVATPVGSNDYARRAGGPSVETSRAIATVVPVGAFSMSQSRWVVDLEDPLRIDRQREVKTSLLLDGRTRSIPNDSCIEITSGPFIDFVVPERARL